METYVYLEYTNNVSSHAKYIQTSEYKLLLVRMGDIIETISSQNWMYIFIVTYAEKNEIKIWKDNNLEYSCGLLKKVYGLDVYLTDFEYNPRTVWKYRTRDIFKRIYLFREYGQMIFAEFTDNDK